jgi:hypothetical protein
MHCAGDWCGICMHADASFCLCLAVLTLGEGATLFPWECICSIVVLIFFLTSFRSLLSFIILINIHNCLDDLKH